MEEDKLDVSKDNAENKYNYMKSLIPLSFIFCIAVNEAVCRHIYDVQHMILDGVKYSWDGALATAIKVGGAIFVGIVMQLYGRQMALHQAFILMIIGMVCVGCYVTFLPLILVFSVGDFINKFVYGMYCVTIVYITETTSPEHRSFFLSLVLPMYLAGSDLPHVFQVYDVIFNVRDSVLLVILVGFVSLLGTMQSAASSPLSDNESNENLSALSVKKSDEKLARPSQSDPPKDDQEYKDGGENSISDVESNVSEREKVPTPVYANFNSFAVVLFFSWCNQCILKGCLQLLSYYKKEIDLPPDDRTMEFTTGAVLLSSSMIGSLFTVKFIDRKILIMICSIAIMLLTSMAGAYELMFNDVQPEHKPTRVHKLPIVCLWISLAFTAVGTWTMSIIMVGEMTPSRGRGLHSGLLCAAIILQMVLANFFLKLAMNSRKIVYIYLGLVFSGLKTFTFAYGGIIADTSKKTLKEIDDYLYARAFKAFNLQMKEARKR